jgi:hypothetical protein
LDIFKKRGIQREDILLVLSACIFSVFLWSFYNLFNQIPAFLHRFTILETIGAASYILLFALLESVLFFAALFLFLILISLLLPKKLWGEHFAAIGGMLAILISAVVATIQLIYDQIMELSKTQIGIYSVGLIVGFLIYYLLILRFPRFENAVRAALNGISILSIIYAALGLVSLLIVIVRNIF